MLGVSGTPVLDAVGKLGDLGDRLGGKRTFSILTYGLMTRPAEQPVGCVYDTYSALRYDLMGIIPWRNPLCPDSYYTLPDGR